MVFTAQLPKYSINGSKKGPLPEATPTESDRQIWSDLVGFGRIRSGFGLDSVWIRSGFGRIRSDLVGFGRIRSDVDGIGWIWSDLVGLGRIWSDLVGFGRIWSDLVGVAPGRGP